MEGGEPQPVHRVDDAEHAGVGGLAGQPPLLERGRDPVVAVGDVEVRRGQLLDQASRWRGPPAAATPSAGARGDRRSPGSAASCWTSSIVRVNSGPARCSSVTRAGGASVVVWCQTRRVDPLGLTPPRARAPGRRRRPAPRRRRRRRCRASSAAPAGRRRARRPRLVVRRGVDRRPGEIDAGLVERARTCAVTVRRAHSGRTTRAGKSRTLLTSGDRRSRAASPRTRPARGGSSRSAASRSSDGSPLDVDERDRRLAATEDAVHHVLDVELRGAEPVEDLGEHADPVEVAHRQGDTTRAGRGRG